ncbi:MAG: hypothetical protein ISF22_08005 [Methanomassiliicoccus sp.]|nr:hypothetical protein [Methanomassiliicoccus sp.]
MMPSQPSMIEAWSYHDLRCNVQERERAVRENMVMDRPMFSGGDRASVLPSMSRRRPRPKRIDWPRLLVGSALAVAGSVWTLSILGFVVPWSAFISLGLVVAGGFIIVAALNHGTERSRIVHDRCDH